MLSISVTSTSNTLTMSSPWILAKFCFVSAKRDALCSLSEQYLVLYRYCVIWLPTLFQFAPTIFSSHTFNFDSMMIYKRKIDVFMCLFSRFNINLKDRVYLISSLSIRLYLVLHGHYYVNWCTFSINEISLTRGEFVYFSTDEHYNSERSVYRTPLENNESN